MNPPVAHAGHVVLWVLYAIPVLIVLGSIVVTARRDRRERSAASGATKRPRRL